MSVTKNTVLHTSRLARLNIAAEISGGSADVALEAFATQMDSIVQYMDILAEADTSGVEPMFSPMERVAPPRADEVIQNYSREEILQNAPEQENGCFTVPKVL